MSKINRVIDVHGWGSSPDADWHPWLRHELETRGISVVAPSLPHPDAPEMELWIEELARQVGELDASTVLVGHSIGCQTILRYLSQQEAAVQVGGLILVAPWVTLQNLSEEEKPIAQPWLTTPIEFARIKAQVGCSVALFSDNDMWVPSENQHRFEEELGAETILLSHRGHFSSEEGVTEVLEVVEIIDRWGKED